MAINFPSSPSTNDTYSYGGKTWRFNGVAWEIYSSGNIGNITVTGNVTAGNILTDNYFFSNGDPFVSSNYGNADVATYLTEYTGNITAGNVDVTSNVTASYFLGNGSQLTGIQSGANVTASETPPGSPSDGDVWIDTSIGVQLIYVDDGDSSQWVEFQSTTNTYNLGGSYGDSNVLSYLGQVAGNIVPAANVTYDLGSTTNRWNSLYLAGNTIDLGGAQIKADPDAGTITILPVLSTGGSSTTQALIISNTGIVTAETDSNGNISTESILAATANATNLSSSVVGGGGGVSTVQTVIRSMIFGGG